MVLNKIYQGDALVVLKTFEDKCVHCIVTSPPYYGLRDYGTAVWVGGDNDCDHRGEAFRTKENINKNTGTGKDVKNKDNYQFYKSVCKKCGANRIDSQLGLEETSEEYIANLTEVFNECKRVLRDDGTLWVNIGDSYAGSGGAHKEHHKNPGISNSFKRNGVPHWGDIGQPENYLAPKGMKPKDLIGIPWMLAFALRDSGWYLRSEIIWYKRNPMPESVKDRPTKSHEQIFLLSKNEKYFYDAEAIKELSIEPNDDRGARKNIKRFPTDKINGIRNSGIYPLANKRTVWDVTTKPYAEAHFATFPEDLIVDCIKAGCPEDGIVLDPFMGAGTTALVARKLHRNFIGIELNPAYVKLAEKRLKKELGLFI